jgi:hypothetical protein
MQITRTSILSGITRTLDIPVTEEQMQAWRDGASIQRAMPNLSAVQREFILTGINDEEWDALMVGEDD